MTTLILLAAGASSRMGAVNKLLLPLGDSTVLQQTLAAALASEVDEVWVVTGHESERVEAVLQPLGVHFVYNPAYEKGMTSSIQAGVRASGINTGAYLICPGDMPYLKPAHINLLIQQFNALDGQPGILAPVHNGKRGHPVLFSKHFRDEILAHTDPDGCKGIIQRHAGQLMLVEVENEGILHDIDTPEAYTSARNKKDQHGS
ncbi:MAG: nucleotidyltransferase family protein [Saprospiraceae bacterium]|jgi:molybdenum cofactor cytidylyltransferase|nr:nucleotidyltransferase family protein [Saprospiraceae bacterium]